MWDLDQKWAHPVLWHGLVWYKWPAPKRWLPHFWPQISLVLKIGMASSLANANFILPQFLIFLYIFSNLLFYCSLIYSGNQLHCFRWSRQLPLEGLVYEMWNNPEPSTDILYIECSHWLRGFDRRNHFRLY